ncbi:MAG: hypothetical protein DYG96_13855 [Chlorobi bacterium CHB2]|nr:hypothetical protein [Chlorobi bacterium CHB2]
MRERTSLSIHLATAGSMNLTSSETKTPHTLSRTLAEAKRLQNLQTTMAFILRSSATILLLIALLTGCGDQQQQSAASNGQTTTAASGSLLPDLKKRTFEPQPSPEFAKWQKQIAEYQAEVAKHPDQLANYLKAAEIYLQESRVSGDHHFYIPVASAILDTVLVRQPSNFEGLMLRAFISMTQHQFANAKQQIQKAIATNSKNAFAWGVLCDAFVELGQYDSAVVACDSMMAIRPDIRAYSRASYLRELFGDAKGAMELMLQAVNSGGSGEESKAWAAYTLGMLYLNAGKLDTAQYIFQKTLEERPSYPYATAGQAMAKGMRGEYPAAMELLTGVMEVSTEHIFLEQLADLYLAMNKPQEAKGLEQKVIKAFKQHEESGWNVDRELALFSANHRINLDDAVARAKRDHQSRPANIDACDTYAWALFQNNNAADALPLIRTAIRMNTQHATLFYHAAAIYAANNLRDSAAILLKKATAINPGIDLINRAAADSLRLRLR